MREKSLELSRFTVYSTVRQEAHLAGIHRVPVSLSVGQVKRLRRWMRDREILGEAESLIAGLLHGGAGPLDDDAVTAAMALVDQYIALHGPRWAEVLQRRADASGADPAQAVEPRLN